MAAPAWMLDTNVLSDLIRNPRGLLAARVGRTPPDTLCTSIVVACELRFGARRKASAALTSRVEQLLDSLLVLPFDAPADLHYADIRAALEAAGTPIGSHDLFIAAHARAQALTLVTHNLREFQRVPGLQVEDWLSAPASESG
jgi:tRNA(fMet)-specific endonuclease VapC